MPITMAWRILCVAKGLMPGVKLHRRRFPRVRPDNGHNLVMVHVILDIADTRFRGRTHSKPRASPSWCASMGRLSVSESSRIP